MESFHEIQCPFGAFQTDVLQGLQSFHCSVIGVEISVQPEKSTRAHDNLYEMRERVPQTILNRYISFNKSNHRYLYRTSKNGLLYSVLESTKVRNCVDYCSRSSSGFVDLQARRSLEARFSGFSASMDLFCKERIACFKATS